MISYELAKQLQKAGFPQCGDEKGETRGCVVCSDFDFPWKSPDLTDKGREEGKKNHQALNICGEGSVVYPTLSELIEACGDRFSCLWYFNGEWIAKWFVDMKQIEFGAGNIEVIKVDGSTPEEVVANLWLALQNK